MVTEYINKTTPNFKIGVIVPVVNTIIGSQAELIYSGNYNQQFCVFTSPMGTTYNLSTKKILLKMVELQGLIPMLKIVV